MKAPDFEYQRPATLAQALAALADADLDAMPLAGGQSLMPMMNFRVANPGRLVDLADLADLRGITRNGATIRIGAMTRYAELAASADVREALPLIAMALPHIAHDAIRNRGTIGGSLALADPAAEMPAIALALGATFEVAGQGGVRRIAADDFFQGYYDTALEQGELIVAIHLPVATPDHAFGFHELTQRHGDYALAGVAIARKGPDHRIAFFGVADRPLRITALEKAISAGTPVQDALTHLADVDWTGDLKASSATRQRLAGVALGRAIGGMRP
ncbi:FAD binding domain-containing protein [Loktanella sp. DJP18]|uniref:FAD binding domain-containing protein n=1 Tax=Loktanella sp. DJP18 TaxID=3409788 RepID=UPI003BB7F232